MTNLKTIPMRPVHHEKGLYAFLEFLKEYADFSIQRIYFLQDMVPEASSGHAHKVEQEIFVMLRGTCFASINDGTGMKEFEFRALDDALYVPNFVWHGFKNFSPDGVLLALSSVTHQNPDRSDYIDNYDEFLAVVESRRAGKVLDAVPAS